MAVFIDKRAQMPLIILLSLWFPQSAIESFNYSCKQIEVKSKDTPLNLLSLGIEVLRDLGRLSGFHFDFKSSGQNRSLPN